MTGCPGHFGANLSGLKSSNKHTDIQLPTNPQNHLELYSFAIQRSAILKINSVKTLKSAWDSNEFLEVGVLLLIEFCSGPSLSALTELNKISSLV